MRVTDGITSIISQFGFDSFLILLSLNFKNNWLRIIQHNLDFDFLSEYLHSTSRLSKSKYDLGKDKQTNFLFPKMRSKESFELYLNLLYDFEKNDLNKDASNRSLINLVIIEGRPFREQLLYFSTSSLLNINSPSDAILEKRNIRSMPMKNDTLENINLNFPLVPDNIDYSRILNNFSIPNIIDIFNGILLEEKILIVTDYLESFASIVESFNELLFPFNPNNYFTISFITDDMIDFLYAPVPYIIG